MYGLSSLFVSSPGLSPVSKMSLAQRVLLTWVFTLVFLIMLVLKLDGKVGVLYYFFSKWLKCVSTLPVKNVLQFIFSVLSFFQLIALKTFWMNHIIILVSALQVQWNWFLIFLPVWVFDGILILMLAIKMAGRCKPGYDPRNGSPDLRLRTWYLAAMLLKLGFCLTLCAKLEKLADVKLTFVCIPLWTMLLGALVELGLNIFPDRREP